MRKMLFAALALCGVAGVLALTSCRSGGAAEPSPKYAWRGYMLDVSRHFFTVDEVKRTLDLMHEHGLNVFHWHLTDHNGWRLEIDRYPKLTSVGAVRKASSKRSSTMFLDVVDGDYGPYFYTKDQVRDIVRYAAARGIRIVPEIDIPGHSGAAISAYPELGCTGIGNCSELCLGKESTFEMYENILDEVAELFPGEVIHIGGDGAQELPRPPGLGDEALRGLPREEGPPADGLGRARDLGRSAAERHHPELPRGVLRRRRGEEGL